MNVSLFRFKDEAKMLFGPSWLYAKLKKSMDFFAKS